MVKLTLMKIILVLSILISISSFACDKEKVIGESEFLRDIKTAREEDEKRTCVKILLESFNPSNNHYVSSVGLNVRNENEQVVAFVTPEAYKASYGQLVYSACFLDGYLKKTILVINSRPKISVKLQDGHSHSVSEVLCVETEYVELGNAIETFSSESKQKKP